MQQRLQLAILVGGERDPLLGPRPSADQAVHALRDSAIRTGRPASFARGRGEDLMIPQRLAAEPAADEGRADVHLVLLDAEHLGQRSRRPVEHLRRIVDDQPLALPDDGRGVGLDRIVVVPRRAVDRIDAVRRRCQRLFGIALFFSRLARTSRASGMALPPRSA